MKTPASKPPRPTIDIGHICKQLGCNYRFDYRIDPQKNISASRCTVIAADGSVIAEAHAENHTQAGQDAFYEIVNKGLAEAVPLTDDARLAYTVEAQRAQMAEMQKQIDDLKGMIKGGTPAPQAMPASIQIPPPQEPSPQADAPKKGKPRE